MYVNNWIYIYIYIHVYTSKISNRFADLAGSETSIFSVWLSWAQLHSQATAAWPATLPPAPIPITGQEMEACTSQQVTFRQDVWWNSEGWKIRGILQGWKGEQQLQLDEAGPKEQLWFPTCRGIPSGGDPSANHWVRKHVDTNHFQSLPGGI